MPPSKGDSAKQSFGRPASLSTGGMTMSAQVYHPATNLMPPTPPLSPSGVAPSFPPRALGSNNVWSRQNSHNGKYS